MKVRDFCTGLQHVGVPTNDIERTKAFYEQLGFQLVMQTANGDEQVAFLQLHNLVIETYQNFAATMRSMSRLRRWGLPFLKEGFSRCHFGKEV